MKTVDVVGALITHQGKILIAQRPEGKAQALLWEFPGGKVEPGESPEESLVREIEEELGVRIRVGDRHGELIHDYAGLRVRLTCFWARLEGGEPHPRQCRAIAWVSADELDRYEFSPADVPFVRQLKQAGIPW